MEVFIYCPRIVFNYVLHSEQQQTRLLHNLQILVRSSASAMATIYGVPYLEEEDPRKRLAMATYPATLEDHDRAKLHYWRKLRGLTSSPRDSMAEAGQATSNVPAALSSLHPRELSQAQQVGLSAATIRSSSTQISHPGRSSTDPFQAGHSATALFAPHPVYWKRSHSRARNKRHTKYIYEARPLSSVQELPSKESAYSNLEPPPSVARSPSKPSRLAKLEEAKLKLDVRQEEEMRTNPVILQIRATSTASESVKPIQLVHTDAASKSTTEKGISANGCSSTSSHSPPTMIDYNREATGHGQKSVCFFLPRSNPSHKVRNVREEAKEFQRSSQAFEAPPIDNSMLWLKAFYERELSSTPCTKEAVRAAKKQAATVHLATPVIQSKSLLEECCDAHASFREGRRSTAATDANDQGVENKKLYSSRRSIPVLRSTSADSGVRFY